VPAPTAASRQAGPIDDRHLDWDGCFNVRDLGGLPTAGDHVTRRGAPVRADSLAGLSAAGWDALRAHGVRTVVDLRNDDEVACDDAAAALVVELLERLDLEALLRRGGLMDDDLAALRARMLHTEQAAA
jgi:hypothetical protein